MQSPDHLKPPGGRFNLTPMIDVVFLLIIFFIVSNNIIQQDTAIEVELPPAETGILPQEEQTKTLTITIANSGMIYVGTLAVSKEMLRQILRECQNSWGEDAEILIRTDRTILYGEIRPILLMAAESGIMRVSFAVQKI